MQHTEELKEAIQNIDVGEIEAIADDMQMATDVLKMDEETQTMSHRYMRKMQAQAIKKAKRAKRKGTHVARQEKTRQYSVEYYTNIVGVVEQAIAR